MDVTEGVTATLAVVARAISQLALEPAKIGVDLVARNAAGSDPAGDRPELVVSNQRADVVL